MVGRTNAQVSSGVETVAVRIISTGRDGTGPELAAIYSHPRGDGRYIQTGISFTIEVAVNSLFFVGYVETGWWGSPYTTNVIQTWDTLQDSESYYDKLKGFIVVNKESEHTIDFTL